MTRKEFLEKSMIMGIGLPLLNTVFLQSCGEEDPFFPKIHTDFKGKIIIIGAGAAGLAAGFLLNKYKIDFEILEAAPVYGGRLKSITDFADFPIDLGAEWIHVDPQILKDIADTDNLDERFETIVYNPQSIQSWKNGKLRSHPLIKSLYSEWKFKRSSWYDFFDQNIVPEIADKIRLNKPVTEINYESEQVVLKARQDEFVADKVLITVPVKILQQKTIKFMPALPLSKSNAINNIFMGDGIKIFVEFKERFYPDILAFGNIFRALSEEDKFVYDAAFKKDTDKHILGLFAINDKANNYTKLGSDEEIITHFLSELDEMFEGKASTHYVKHVIQNWTAEPHIGGAYSYSFEGRQKDIVESISEPLAKRVYFAGEALSLENQAMVQGACQSAYATIARMLEG